MMLSLVTLALVGSTTAIAPLNMEGEIIDGQYLVIFKRDSTLAQRDNHMRSVQVCLDIPN